MYKKRGDMSDIKSIVAKLKGETAPHIPVIYSSSDISAAKNILTRLLSDPTRNEVSYSKVATRQIEER